MCNIKHNKLFFARLFIIFLNNKMDFDKVYSLINHHNISVRKLADIVGYSASGLNDAIRKKTMRVDLLEKIAHYFKVSPSIFFEDIIDISHLQANESEVEYKTSSKEIEQKKPAAGVKEVVKYYEGKMEELNREIGRLQERLKNK